MAQIEYDEDGGISLYFFAAFWGLVLIPLTYFYWPRSQKRTASSIACKCKQCALKNELFSKGNPASNLVNWLKRLLFFTGWVVLVVLIMQASKVEKDFEDYDPFEILGVDRGASEGEIKKAYRKLTLIYHPDKEGGDEVKFMQISKAHAALTNDDAKENWEKYGNPDGPKAATFGIALPSWIVDKNNSFYVLGVYVACFMVVLPIVVTVWWHKSNKTAGEKIHVYTSQLYHDYVHRTPQMSLKIVLKVLGSSFEFDKKSNSEMIFRSTDEQELKKVQRELPTAPEDKKTNKIFSFPHSVKARTILNAHMHRVSLPLQTLELDRQYIVRKTPMLLQEMVNVFVKLLFLYFQRRVPNKVKLSSLESMMKLHQYLIQAVGEGKSPLLQLPHLHESQLKSLNIRKREVKTLEHLAKLPNKERESMLNFMEQQEYQDLMTVLGLLPLINVEVETQVIDDQDQHQITAHSIVTVKCTLTRHNFKSLYFNTAPHSNNSMANGGGAPAPSQQHHPPKHNNSSNRPKKGAPKKQSRGGKKLKQNQQLTVNNNNISAAESQSSKPTPEETSDKGENVNGGDDEDECKTLAATNEIQSNGEVDNSTGAGAGVVAGEASQCVPSVVANQEEDSSDGELWDPEEDPAKKLRELLDSKPKSSFEVHCPYFPEIKQEGWWVYMCEQKTHTLKSAVEKVSGLKERESVELKFTAPEKGHYTYSIHVRSDCYVGLDVEKELKLNVLEAKVIEDSKQWHFTDDEEEESEEDDGEGHRHQKRGDKKSGGARDEDSASESENERDQQGWTSVSEDDINDEDSDNYNNSD